MQKKAQFGMLATGLPATSGPTIGSLEYFIMMDDKMDSFLKSRALNEVRSKTNYAPSDTPLASVIGLLSGGLLGTLLARYFNFGLPGQIVGGLFGSLTLGKQVSRMYTALTDRGSDMRRIY